MFKTIRLFVYLVVTLVLIVLGVWVYNAWFGNPKQVLKIDDTAVMVEEIKKISQLFTAVYYDELVLDTFKLQDKVPAERLLDAMVIMRPGSGGANSANLMSFRRINMVVIARGRVFGGYDFSRLQESDLQVIDRSVIFELPPAEVLEVVINPSDYEIFIEEGRWSLEEAVALKQRAAKQMSRRAVETGILESSETLAINLLTDFFKALGFENITIVSNVKQTPDSDLQIPPRTME